MNSKNRKTLEAIFRKPTSGNLIWDDVEKLIKSLGGEVIEGRGSRIRLVLNGKRAYFHRPHPGKEAKKYVIEDTREFLLSAGIKP